MGAGPLEYYSWQVVGGQAFAPALAPSLVRVSIRQRGDARARWQFFQVRTGWTRFVYRTIVLIAGFLGVLAGTIALDFAAAYSAGSGLLAPTVAWGILLVSCAMAALDIALFALFAALEAWQFFFRSRVA